MSRPAVTVLTPVSPIPSHPETAILDQTIESVRFHLPDAEIMLMFDGIRRQMGHRTADYHEFTRRMLWRADKVYGNMCPYIFEKHKHQVGMLRETLGEVRTPLVLFVEQDTPLVTDELIDWDACIDMITSGKADVIRFHHEGVIPREHAGMCHGLDGQFLRTSQFSARPHLASLDYYRRILADHFTARACCFLEDKMHGIVDEAYKNEGMPGLDKHKIWIYHPDTGNIKRSWHSDGRAGDAKYERQQRF